MRRFKGVIVGWSFGVLALFACVPGHAASLRFFALGDMPYAASEAEPMTALLRDAAAAGSPFVVHVGDIKSGGSRCTDANLHQIAEVFRSLAVPVVYTPGDNEWTDCHRRSAGGLDPLARLRRVRQVFFADDEVLRLGGLGAVSQAPDFPENTYFEYAGVMFAALHVVGSNNGFDPHNDRAMAEFAARDAATRGFLRRAVEAAAAGGAQALVILMQADLGLGNDRDEGFRGIKADLLTVKDRFEGPVLLLHGDSHTFIHDRPFVDPATGAAIPRMMRIEVPGSPWIGGVWITVDPAADDPFAAEPVYSIPSNTLGE